MHQFSDKTDNFDFLGSNMPKNGFWGQNFKNVSLDLESASLRYSVHQFSDKKNNFEFLGPNMPKNGFWGQNFKNQSLDLESASLRYYAHQFSDKTNNFAQKWILRSEFQKSKSGFGINTSKLPCVLIFSQNGQLLIFRPKFGEIAQLRAIFLVQILLKV